MSLIESAQRNELEAVKRFIVGGVDVNGMHRNGRTALWWAACRGHLECATVLLDVKADVEKGDVSGTTPLHIASLNGHVECVRLLIQHKANVNGNSPLHLASGNGHLACVQMLVAAGASREVDRRDNHDWTPLTNAIFRNHPSVAEFLLHSGAKMRNVPPDVNVPDWMNDIITKRRNVMQSLLVLYGVLRRRVKVPGSATAHIGNHIPRDVVMVIALLAWTTRLDSRWNSDRAPATK